MTTRLDTMPVPLPQRRGAAWLRTAMVFLICVVLVDALVGERGLAQRSRAARDYAAASQTLGAVQQENAALRDRIRRLRTDRRTIESVARQDLGLIRPGEILFIVKPAVTPPLLPSPTPARGERGLR
jgi:cell division protein FtsB